jgi:hypothetical protein
MGPRTILFIFTSAANFRFAVVSKKAMAAKGKKALECREGISLTNAKEFSAKSQGRFFFPSIKTPDIQLLQLDKKYAFHRKRRM